MSDHGHAGIELALGAGLLVIPMAVLVLAFGPWSETRVAAEALAAEGSRSAVIELDTAVGEGTTFKHAVDMGIDLDDVRLGWCGSEPARPSSGSCPLARGSVVALSVDVWTPLISTPFGTIGGLWVRGEHSEPVDLYRSLP